MRHALSIAATALIAAVAATPADAKCTRLAFSVNDYGKDGPIKDAKALLDTYIAKWTAERGIKTYRTGKKDVNCELFLDVVVFDEHTCRAEANVCWDEKNVGAVPKSAATDGAAPAPAAAAPVTTGTLPAPEKPAASPAAAPTTIAPIAPPAAPAPVAPPAVKPPAAAAPGSAG